MGALYRHVLRPMLFRCDPEWVHDRAIQAGRIAGSIGPLRGLVSACYGFQDRRLKSVVAGIEFENPMGLAAGYDKNGRTTRIMEALGFGHIEIGSVSADPSDGNPRPRLWRLPLDEGIAVHYGLPNEGATAVAKRLARTPRRVPLGINLVKTNRGLHAPPDGEDAIRDDYMRSVRILQEYADFLTLNLSCPNTAMGRAHFCDLDHVGRLLRALSAIEIRKPVFLKVSPAGGERAIDRLLETVADAPFVAGFSFNLPPGLPADLRTPPQRTASMRGAVAGKPAATVINTCIAQLYQRMDRTRYHIIGAGGVFSADDAYEKIRLGASLVQLYTGLVYEGPDLLGRIARGLGRRLERDGLTSIADAVGTAHRETTAV